MKLRPIKSYYIIPVLIFLVFPIIVFSQPTFTSTTVGCDTGVFGLIGADFKCSVGRVLSIIRLLIPILFAMAFIVFFWGLSKFILSSNNQADIEKGKTYMIWGVIALFLLITFRTIIAIVADDLGIGNGNVTPILPTSSQP
jgi:Na+-driven multidrug efflux pump